MSAITTTTIQPKQDSLAFPLRPSRLPALPWRDPHSVPPEKLASFIVSLNEACIEHPENADLLTCLGIAHAMNYDVYQSMDALEQARSLEPQNFFAQLKYSELLYRLRILDRAEEETIHALDLAGNGWELSLARKQLSEIRRLNRKGLIPPKWTKSPKSSAITFLLILSGVSFLFMVWK
jgi:hypothetical protein